MLQGKRIAVPVEEGFGKAELMESLRAMKDVGAKVVVVGSGYLSWAATPHLGEHSERTPRQLVALGSCRPEECRWRLG